MTRRFLSAWLVVLAASFVSSSLVAQDEMFAFKLEDAGKRLLKGQLSAAEALLDEIVAAAEEPESDRPPQAILWSANLMFADISARRGDYERALADLALLPAAFTATRPPALLRAQVLGRIGRYDEAGAILQTLIAADAGDRQARHQLGEVMAAAGQRKAARELWTANTQGDRPTDAVQLAFLGRSYWRLGGRKNIETASQALVDSLGANAASPDARITYGTLKFEAYGETSGFPSGEKDLQKALDTHGDHEEALLAMYRLRTQNAMLDGGKTERFLERVLAQNPRCVEALVLRGSNILDDRRFDEAAQWFDKALAVNGKDIAALCHRAAVSYLLAEQRAYEDFRARALVGDPGFSAVDRVLAEHLAALYRFGDAVPFFEAALAADGEDIEALHGLARALIYTGRGGEAKQHLERAKLLANGFVHPWRNNALAAQELLEEQYKLVENGPFRLYLHRDDAELLAAYMMPLHLEAAATLGAKYGIQPSGPVRVEVFHTWDDFSVRTIGFRGFTALGACFGSLITLVSPGDTDVRRQDFMWEATVWHEFTHVLTLALSKNRVPRWLTEGFSVYEEKMRDRTWERGMDRELLDAFHNEDIPPLRLLNRLFRGPRILFGYYQGGLVVDLIVRRYGFAKVVELLRAFGDDLGLEESCQRALGVSSQQIDRDLLELVTKEKLRGMRLVPRHDDNGVQRLLTKAAIDKTDLDSRVALAWAFLQRDNPVDAGRWLAEVMRADPDNGPAQLVRAEMLHRRKEVAAAIECWQRGFAAGADDFDSRIRCGDALLASGDPAGAEDQWQRAKACWPGCTEQETAPELRLARLYRDQGDGTRAQMEMKTFCRRTARAFTPRMTLAEFERDAGNRAEEVRYLVECNRIDPFHRTLHVQLGEAYEAIGKQALAALEFEMAAAVPPQLDRRYLPKDAQAPAADGPEERGERGALWVRAAKLRHTLGDAEKASALLERAVREAAGSAAADDAKELQQEWRGR